MRTRYRVVLICEDGSRPETVVWADSPDHAAKKARSKIKPASPVTHHTVEEFHDTKQEM